MNYDVTMTITIKGVVNKKPSKEKCQDLRKWFIYYRIQ